MLSEEKMVNIKRKIVLRIHLSTEMNSSIIVVCDKRPGPQLQYCLFQSSEIHCIKIKKNLLSAKC